MPIFVHFHGGNLKLAASGPACGASGGVVDGDDPVREKLRAGLSVRGGAADLETEVT